MMERKRLTGIAGRQTWLATVVDAAEKSQGQPMELVSDAQLQELQALKRAYGEAVRATSQSKTQRKAAVVASTLAVDQLKKLVLQNFTTLDHMISRGDLEPQHRDYFKTPETTTKPKAGKYAEWLPIADRFIEGNRRIQEMGLREVRDPAPERVQQARHRAEAALDETCDAKRRDKEAIQHRNSFNSTISQTHQLLAAEIKIKLHQKTPAEIRETLRSYGYQFFNRDKP